ncbi:hypothetical protein DH2020_017724 [Rehmannia glutinosa]|uniref:Myb-like domain-containing protein n=1 Tax=Rehmannia glutinosa TaxID=99300 RepID=A0ABR0WVD2_REHGL
MDLTVAANQGGGGNNPMLRDYRKGNWTLQETMVLIEAKKMDDERRMKTSQGQDRGKPAELRWKWVEDYCWKNGCLRSQNQCNDKWDNLMRDFKKVREYEKRVILMAEAGVEKSYWRIEKNERKDNNLPSNMLPQIYEALVEVVERKGQRVAVAGGGGGGGSSSAVLPVVGVEKHVMPPQMRQYPVIQAPAAIMVPAAEAEAPPVQAPAEIPSGGVPSSQPLPAVDSDTSEHSDSPAKRRKRRGGEGSSRGVEGSRIEEIIGTAISKSGRMIAEAIQTCEEREERRHRQVLSVHERRLQIEESKAEINRQGINGLVDAINNLANSILALASHNNNNQSASK